MYSALLFNPAKVPLARYRSPDDIRDYANPPDFTSPWFVPASTLMLNGHRAHGGQETRSLNGLWPLIFAIQCLAAPPSYPRLLRGSNAPSSSQIAGLLPATRSTQMMVDQDSFSLVIRGIFAHGSPERSISPEIEIRAGSPVPLDIAPSFAV